MAKKVEVDPFPSVLAFEKKLVPSDGRMFAAKFADRGSNEVPLRLHEKSVRGTISNRLSSKQENDPAKIDAEVEKANLQTVDSCSLPAGYDTLKLQFTLKVLSGVQEPCACNVASFQVTCRDAVNDYISRTSFQELATRYATNLANGRFLWRNRVGAEQVRVVISVEEAKAPNKKTVHDFDAYEFDLRSFDNKSTKLKELADLIAVTLSGKRPSILLDVVAYAQMGEGQDVYPSEELVSEKGDKKSKFLYSVDGIAAMHSQKLGNAIRTIDTWYMNKAERPIAIEAYGSVTNLGVAYRKPRDKTDFYTLFDQFGCGTKIEPNEEHYVMAMLVRGGVFGKSSK